MLITGTKALWLAVSDQFSCYVHYIVTYMMQSLSKATKISLLKKNPKYLSRLG